MGCKIYYIFFLIFLACTIDYGGGFLTEPRLISTSSRVLFFFLFFLPFPSFEMICIIYGFYGKERGKMKAKAKNRGKYLLIECLVYCHVADSRRST